MSSSACRSRCAPSRSACRACRPTWRHAAASLGAPPWRTQAHVVLPLIKNGIVAGAVFAFIHSFTDVNLSLFLARPGEIPDQRQDPRFPRIRLRADARRRVGADDRHSAGARRGGPARDRSRRLPLCGARPWLSRPCASSACRSATATRSPSPASTSTSPDGEFVTLLGPSGCGKTTTLGLIAGFLPLIGRRRPDRGAASVTALPPFRRDIGVVFQDYALFPHMTRGAERRLRSASMRKVAKAEIASARRRGARAGQARRARRAPAA